MASGDTKTNQYLDIAANGTRADLPSDTCCETRTQTLIRGVAERVIGVEEEVERLENNPDVVDIVATYQDLQNYDTSGLTDKDIIRVLEDSTHSNNSTYYRWNAATNQFDFVGEITGGSSVNVVQTTGTSTTDVMSQKAVTDELYRDNKKSLVQIGLNTVSTGGTFYESVAIGRSCQAGRDGTAIGAIGAVATAQGSVAIGPDAKCDVSNANNTIAIGKSAKAKTTNSISIGNAPETNGDASIAIGAQAAVSNLCNGSVAIGSNSTCTRTGEVNVGSSNTQYGYNSTNYRVIGGVHDGVDAHDAMTVGQANSLIDAINTALGSSIPHIGS